VPPVASAYLRDGENVALVAPRDPAALAGRIGVLLEAPEERARLADGARKLATRLAWPTIAEETRGVYRRGLAGRLSCSLPPFCRSSAAASPWCPRAIRGPPAGARLPPPPPAPPPASCPPSAPSPGDPPT